RDVDSERSKCGNPRRLEIDASRVQHLLVEMCVEVTDSHLEAGYHLVPVVVSELHHGLLCGRTGIRTEIVVDCHALPGPRGSVVERIVPHCEAARLARPALPDVIREAERPVHLL